ncbi:putative tail protein [Rhizobium phage RHEph06]|uniref:Putative internal virion protein n=2 Tax=Kleczkowskavirus RHEph4 TaxID=1921526 RepID=L7TJL7_9CAUD|nr:putative tail protein [Rhizobium phage RHEph06]YP_009598469.1 putative internal virion protein [Rhizobium phage RHEph04]AGC35789.1 putative tail protein [Rhizobium phage RHEph05]QXV74906.1 putative tail tape measure protein [Rhizobium phage RHEph26]AGC35713.1 putative internal virion protein [Rhizobium phage RHEph04]AGC35870.1 putative tail protein [Rhizobium phage RHEph06]
MATVIDELIALLGYKIEGEADLKRFNKGLDSLEKKAYAVGKALGTVAVAGAAITTAAFAALGKSVIETSAQFEGYGATLETIEGSADKAKKSLAWITEFAKTTPYDVAGVTEAFVKLKAYGLDPMDGSLVALGDAASGMGKTLNQAVEAMADAVTGENERLKEFGITTKVAGDQITYTWRQNGKEMSKTLKKNGVEIAKFLRDNFEGRFAGAMIRQSKTWNGMISNLGDTWTGFQRMIGDAGFFEAVKGQLGRLMDYLGQLQADGTMQKWAKRFSDMFITVTNGAATFVERIIFHFNSIQGWIDNHPDMFKGVLAALAVLAAFRFPRTFALIVLEDLLTWLEGGDSVIGKIAESLSQLTGINADTLGKIVATLAGMATFATIAGGVSGLATAISLLASALTTLGGAGAAAGLAALGKAGGAAGTAAGAGGGIMGLLGRVGKMVGAAGLGLSAALTLGGNGELNALPKEKVQQMLDAQREKYKQSSSAAPVEVPMTAAQAVSNAMANAAKMKADAAGTQVTQTDNSNRSVTNNIQTTVNQSVTQATDAPGAAASATADAVNKAAQPARMQGSAAGSGAF